MTDRIDIIQRIVNLRNVEGRTEAEAMAAINRAERLMEGYRIEEAELAMAEATGEVKLDIIKRRSDEPCMVGSIRHKAQICLHAIKMFTETECVINPGGHVTYLGDRPDVELAHYLLDLIKETMDREYVNWRRSQQAVGQGAKASFQMSMASRINYRLDEARQAREARARELMPQIADKSIKELTSTALVVVAVAEQKRKEVNAKFLATYPKLGRASAFNYHSSNYGAATAGRRAGDRVNFGRPMEGTNHAAIAAE